MLMVQYDTKWPISLVYVLKPLINAINIYYRPSATSRWLDIGQVLFFHFYGQRRSRGQYPATVTKLAWVIKDLLHGIPRHHVALCFYFGVCRFLLQNVFLKHINIFVFFVFILVDAFGFLVFRVPTQQRNHRKYCQIFYRRIVRRSLR